MVELASWHSIPTDVQAGILKIQLHQLIFQFDSSSQFNSKVLWYQNQLLHIFSN